MSQVGHRRSKQADVPAVSMILGPAEHSFTSRTSAWGQVIPGRHVGADEQEDDGEPFEEKMKGPTATLRGQ